jgi:hypothetical protein
VIRGRRTSKLHRGPLGRALAVAAIGLAGASLALPGCSLLNQEGPEVTCEELACGKINACREGIIAQCADGVHLKYHVCGTTDVCKATWQVEGAYKCTQEATDCEGCRPERTGCSDLPTGAGGGAGSTTSSTTSSTTGATSTSATSGGGSAG